MSKNVPNRRILMAVGLFGVMLGAVGLPIYLHAPKYFSDTYGVSLVSLGAIMFALRVVDFVQDPLLGRLSAIGFLSHRLIVCWCGGTDHRGGSWAVYCDCADQPNDLVCLVTYPFIHRIQFVCDLALHCMQQIILRTLHSLSLRVGVKRGS